MSDGTQPRDAAALARTMAGARRSDARLSATEWATAVATPEDAYDVQHAVARELGWFAAGAVAGHWKSGGASPDAPLTHAPLPPAGVRSSGARFDDMTLHAPAIEAEIALRLRTDVDAARAAALSPAEADALVDGMTVSIEVVDSRWAEGMKAAPALLRLADLQSHGALVLGAWVPYRPQGWSEQRCTVRIGGAAPVEVVGTHALGRPAAVLVPWLQHATRRGGIVRAGTVVTTGTWVGVLPAARGDEVTVAFDGVGEASLRL